MSIIGFIFVGHFLRSYIYILITVYLTGMCVVGSDGSGGGGDSAGGGAGGGVVLLLLRFLCFLSCIHILFIRHLGACVVVTCVVIGDSDGGWSCMIN